MWILTAARREIKVLCVEEMEKHKHGYEVAFAVNRLRDEFGAAMSCNSV